MKVAIVGSCVTRDIFAMIETDCTITRYLAWQGMVSLAANPLDLPLPDHLGAWRIASIRADASKSTFAILSDTEFDALIIDFVDERCGCLEGPNGELITYSPAIDMLGPEYLLENRLRDRRAEWPYMDRREDAMDKFAEGLVSALRGRPAILHRAWWASDGYDVNWVGRNNDILGLSYAGLHRRAPIQTVGLPKEAVRGDPNHKWGPAPYHYEEQYYQEIWRQIDALRPQLGIAVPEQADQRRQPFP